MIFHWIQSDRKPPRVPKTLLNILAVLNSAVVWMISTGPPTYKSSSPFNNPLVTAPKAPITIGIIVTFIFHIFVNSLARSRFLYFFSHSFSFICGQPGQQSPQFWKFPLFFCWLLYGQVFGPRLDYPFVCQSSIGVYVCHSPGQLLSMLTKKIIKIRNSDECAKFWTYNFVPTWRMSDRMKNTKGKQFCQWCWDTRQPV